MYTYCYSLNLPAIFCVAFMTHHYWDVFRLQHDDKRNEESRTSGIFSFIRRNSVGEKDSKLPKHKKPTTEQQVVNSATFSGSDVRNRRVGSIKDRDGECQF